MQEQDEIFRALKHLTRHTPFASYTGHALRITNPTSPHNYSIEQVRNESVRGPVGKIVYGSFTTWHNAPTFLEYTYGRKYRDNDQNEQLR